MVYFWARNYNEAKPASNTKNQPKTTEKKVQQRPRPPQRQASQSTTKTLQPQPEQTSPQAKEKQVQQQSEPEPEPEQAAKPAPEQAAEPPLEYNTRKWTVCLSQQSFLQEQAAARGHD